MTDKRNKYLPVIKGYVMKVKVEGTKDILVQGENGETCECPTFLLSQFMHIDNTPLESFTCILPDINLCKFINFYYLYAYQFTVKYCNF